jgi:hypothetical protein
MNRSIGSISALLLLQAGALSPAVPADQPWQPGAYMEGPTACSDIKADDPLAAHPVIKPYFEAGRDSHMPIRLCIYAFSSVSDGSGKADRKGWVVLADPPAATLEGWIRAACRKEAPDQLPICEDALKHHVSSQNGGQFPVIGFVAEGGGKLCVQHGKAVDATGLLAFQDGVTIQHWEDADRKGVALYCVTEAVDPDIQRRWATTRPIEEVYHVARLAGLRDSCGAELMTAELKARAAELRLNPWLLASRENHIRALRTGEDQMLEIQARRFAQGVRCEGFGGDCADGE